MTQALAIMLRLAAILLLSVALPACKPPPTDAGMARDMPEAAPTFASEPLSSPETEGAMWAESARDPERLIYGIPGEAALLALECIDADGELPKLQITRLAYADEGASALLALVGNGHIGRLPVEAREIGGRSAWQGEAAAADTVWEPLAGPRALGATVPGAGRVELNSSELPGALIEACRTGSEQGAGSAPLP